MIKFSLCSNLYNDINLLSNLITVTTYEDTLYGSEIKEMNFIPPGLEENFSSILNDSIEVQPDTGIFRKPNSMIHFDPFYQHCLWTVIVAMEDTELMIWEQENVKTIFDVETDKMDQFIIDNCFDETKWSVSNKLNIKKNDFVFIRPWLWHSLEKDKLVQIFLLNKKIEQAEEKREDD